MKNINRKVAGALALAITGGGLFFGASAASAAPPPFDPDPHSAAYGSLNFYNAAGKQVTSGTSLNHLFDYAVASTASARPTNKATLFFAFPDHNKPDSVEWYSTTTAGPTTFPIASPPGDVAGQAGKPTVKVALNEANLNAAIGGAVVDTSPGYANLVQVRLKDSGPGLPQEQDGYWTTTIRYDQTAGTWTQVYPAVATATSTTLTATPSPSTVGDTVALQATVTPTAAGTVQFKDGANTLGAPVAVNGSGVAQTTTNSLAAGSHSLSAVFVPTSTADFGGSTGSTTVAVNPPATPTSTVLALSGGYATAGSAATLTANVTGPGSTPNSAGTVQFFDNGSAAPIAGTVTSPTAGTYVLQVPGFAAGAHSIVAKFTPTDTTQFQVSQSAAQAFTTQPAAGDPCAQPGAQCIDPQPIKATIPVGTLVISTPYTADSPLDVGTLALSGDSTKFSGVATFNSIKVTDTRAGNLPWTAKALSTALSNGSNRANGVINAQNVGLTGLAATPGTGFTGTVVTADNAVPATPVAPADPGNAGLGGSTAHTIATADHGQGTVTMRGTLTIQAPSSTEAGLYTGTITFTVG